METSIDRINQRAYNSGTALRFYDRPAGLFEAEQVILHRLLPEIRGKTLLDIGVGAGRTTPFLLDISSDYIGIDYSPVLVRRAKEKFGLQTIFECDVRDLSRFRNDTLDFALFSYNGLDTIPHDGRLKELHEIRRVLKPNALFVFSAHNRNSKDLNQPFWNALRTQRWTLTLFKRVIWALLLQPRHHRMRHLEIHEKDYAVLNDNGLRYRCLIYFISVSAQITQLRACGFDNIEAFDMRGRSVDDDYEALWVYYVARASKS
jgi:SAM-dependent methyltransferase